VDSQSLWLAFALVLVLEGLLPFITPAGWRRLFEQILLMNDGQIRFYGLCSIAAGLVGIFLLA
jgi:uncharacterized protein YjeT (DUF2065 family)